MAVAFSEYTSLVWRLGVIVFDSHVDFNDDPFPGEDDDDLLTFKEEIKQLQIRAAGITNRRPELFNRLDTIVITTCIQRIADQYFARL